MSWIDEEARRVKSENERKKQAEERSLHKSKVLLDKAPAIWRALLDQTREDVRALNETFAGDQSKQVEFQEVPAWTLTVTKKVHPFVSVTARMQPDGRGVTIEIWDAPDALAVAAETERTVAIDLDEKENPRFPDYPEGVAAVSDSILVPVLQALRD